jgi:hypothetical protein
MNDDTPDRNDAIAQGGNPSGAAVCAIEDSSKRRPRIGRRWGGRLFALGGFALLGCGVALGAWGHYSQQQQLMTTAERSRDFVPGLQVAMVEPSPDTMSVFLPGTTAAFAAAGIYVVERKVDRRCSGPTRDRDPAIHAHARAREIIELFCPGNQKWAISTLIAAAISDCRAAPEVSEPRSCPAFASALTLARAHLNATCHVIYLSDNFSVAKGLMVVSRPWEWTKQAGISETLRICG